jgi:fatty acid desaturase
MNIPNVEVMARPALSPDELKRLSTRRPWRSALGIVRIYGLIILVISASLWLGGWWMVLGFVLIAALQHGLSILQHEAVHGLLFHSHRLNDWVGNVLLSYPIGFSLDYRVIHFAHHRLLGEEGDPDLRNYGPFPASGRDVFLKVVRECSGWGAISQFLSKGTGPTRSSSALLCIILAQGVIASLFLLVGHPFAYFWLWLLPLVTLAKGFAQMRNVAEHFIRTHAPAGTERLRTFRSSLLERFFIAPLNFHYHAEHHWYMMVPYYNLPMLRTMLQQRPGYREYAEWTPSYVWVFSQLVRKQRSI